MNKRIGLALATIVMFFSVVGVQALTKGQEQLMEAIEDKKVDVVQSLLDGGLSPNFVDVNGNSPLHDACEGFSQENLEMVNALIAAGAEVDKRNQEGETPLHLAIDGTPIGSRENIAFALIEAGADIQARTPNMFGRQVNDKKKKGGQAPIHFVAEHGSQRLMTLFLERGVELDVQNDDGETPLYLAVSSLMGNKVIDQLLGAGADPNIADRDGNTPLHVAVENQLPITQMYLQIPGLEIDKKNNDGQTPLEIAITENYDFQTAEQLLIAGAKVDAIGTHGLTHLQFAVMTEIQMETQKRISEEALASLAHVGDDSSFLTRLYALYKKLTVTLPDENFQFGQMINVLAANGARVDNPFSDGKTPFHLAVQEGATMAVQTLMNNGADYDRNFPTGLALRLQGMSGMHPFHVALHNEDLETIKVFLAKDQNLVNKRYPKNNRTPYVQVLYFLKKKNLALDEVNKDLLVEILQTLGRAGADLSLADADGVTALHLSAQVFDMTDINIQPPVDLRDGKGQTPLHYAVRAERAQNVQKLLSQRANPDIADNDGDTPFHIASRDGKEDMVDLFLFANGNLDQKNNYDETPLNLARTVNMRNKMLGKKNVAEHTRILASIGDRLRQSAVARFSVPDDLAQAKRGINSARGRIEWYQNKITSLQEGINSLSDEEGDDDTRERLTDQLAEMRDNLAGARRGLADYEDRAANAKLNPRDVRDAVRDYLEMRFDLHKRIEVASTQLWGQNRATFATLNKSLDGVGRRLESYLKLDPVDVSDQVAAAVKQGVFSQKYADDDRKLDGYKAAFEALKLADRETGSARGQINSAYDRVVPFLSEKGIGAADNTNISLTARALSSLKSTEGKIVAASLMLLVTAVAVDQLRERGAFEWLKNKVKYDVLKRYEKLTDKDRERLLSEMRLLSSLLQHKKIDQKQFEARVKNLIKPYAPEVREQLRKMLLNAPQR